MASTQDQKPQQTPQPQQENPQQQPPQETDKQEAVKMAAANVETTFLGFYNSVASCFKKYTANVNLPMRRPSECDAASSQGNPTPTGGSRSSSVSNTPSHEPHLQTEPPVEEPEVPELPEEPELPPGVLCQDGGITYKLLTEEYIDAAVGLLCNHFFKDEPLGKALYLESPREVDHWLSKVLPHMIRHEVSVMALDQTEDRDHLVGVAINSVKLKGQPRGPDDFLHWINPQKDPKIFRIISFLNQVVSDLDFFKMYDVEKIFTFELLNVDKTYGGRGIASKLVEQGINVAKDRDFKCLLSETTGIFSAKIFARNGFKVIREVPYSSQRENGRLVFPATGIHTSARVHVKILQKVDNAKDKQNTPKRVVQ